MHDRADADRILFRIGLNLGDVVARGTDLLGDGVNIAARLQAHGRAEADRAWPLRRRSRWAAR